MEAYIEADIRFHELILEGCHNELLTHLGSTLRGVFRASFTRTQGIAVRRFRCTRRCSRGSARRRAAAEAAMQQPDRDDRGVARAAPRSPVRLTRRVREQDLRDDAVARVHQPERSLEAVGGERCVTSGSKSTSRA